MLRTSYSKSTIKYIGWTVMFLALPFCLFIGYLVFQPDINNYFNRKDFHSEHWIAWEESELQASLRWNMVHDLTTNHKLTGMTTKQIFELLGPPDNNFKSECRYYLGMSGHGIDTGSLILTIERDIVIDWNVWHG